MTGNKQKLSGLIVTQFIGAFNDNAWKLMVFTLATRGLLSSDHSSSQYLATLSMVVFLIPMLLFSLPAAVVADRVSKRRLIVWTKIVEVILMGISVTSLLLFPHLLAFPFIILGLMGAQSALFSPGKYGILPEILPKQELSRANGLLEMFSMFAIIAGTGLGPLLLFADHGGALPNFSWIGPLFLFLFSIFGLVAAWTIPNVPPANLTKINVVSTLKKAWKSIYRDRILWLAFVGTLLYWFIMSLLGQNVLVYAKTLVEKLERGELWQGIPPAAYGIGIGIGAYFSGRLAKDHIEYGFIPLGSLCWAILSLFLGWVRPGLSGTIVTLVFMGMATGALIVPLQAIIQWRSPDNKRGSIIALMNMFHIGAMIVGSLFASSMAMLGWNLKSMLIASAFFVVGATIWAVHLLPEALARLVMILLTKTFYRIRVLGLGNLPKSGPLLLASNHLSLADGFFVMAAVGRPVRFMIRASYYYKWWIRPFAKLLEAIPISEESLSLKKWAIDEAKKALSKGEVVCIFPEGETSRTGMMQPFKQGIEEIINSTKAPIVPVYLDWVWGSIFSYQKGRYFTKRPEKIPYPISVCFGDKLSNSASASQIRDGILNMGYLAWMERQNDSQPISHLFIQQTRRHPWKLSLIEGKKKLSRIEVLILAIDLARKLKVKWKDQTYVAILLPPSIQSVVANLAATLAGKIVININYSLGQAHFNSVIKQTNLSLILTEQNFSDLLPLKIQESISLVLLDHAFYKKSLWSHFYSYILAFLYPCSRLQKRLGSRHWPKGGDILSVLFTSGSTGDPKGVMLSHFNVDANVEGVAQVTPQLPKNKLLAVLPFFHSFGYMNLWLGLNHGIPLVLHTNSLDIKKIGELINEHKVKMVFVTPTLLSLFYRKIPPKYFGSVKLVLTGAEKLPEQLEKLFEEKFGVRPLEGYGTTECSPVIATNTLDVRAPGIFQPGSMKGTVGQPLPGVLVKIVHPETFEEVSPGQQGLLLVKGPNVMKGYLDKKVETKFVFREDWYITGDIASQNEQHYIRILGRLSRFSKIGGEMVPHTLIEDRLHEAAGIEIPSFVVISISDQFQGERLAVVHSFDPKKIPVLLSKIASSGLPNLFIPRADHFISIESLPQLGNGKIDLQSVKEYANIKINRKLK